MVPDARGWVRPQARLGEEKGRFSRRTGCRDSSHVRDLVRRYLTRGASFS